MDKVIANIVCRDKYSQSLRESILSINLQLSPPSQHWSVNSERGVKSELYYSKKKLLFYCRQVLQPLTSQHVVSPTTADFRPKTVSILYSVNTSIPNMMLTGRMSCLVCKGPGHGNLC